MEKKDLLTHSPVRYFDNATNAALKIGEMGLITSKKGLGKTSILVQFGIDRLLDEKSLVHVSFDQHSSNVISWYSSILAEISKRKNVKVEEITEEIMKYRTILNFNQSTFSLPNVVNTLKALKGGGIKIDCLVVDGLDFEKCPLEDLNCFKEFITSEAMTAWFSYTNEAETLQETLPAEKLAAFATVAHIFPNGGKMSLGILKSVNKTEGQSVNLDSKTLLMTK
ncbi:MAG: hypothetical protein MJ188_06110 [Treponema sp.]|nr:hypothetical protein [Treponema sp.]